MSKGMCEKEVKRMEEETWIRKKKTEGEDKSRNDETEERRERRELCRRNEVR